MTGVELTTTRLTLRPPIEADLDGWAGFDADPEGMAFFGGPQTRSDSWTGLATAAGMWSLRGYGLFSVVETKSGDWIGRVGPWAPEGHYGTEIGWAISPRAWGKGYASEAARAAMGWAFDHLGWTEAIHCIDAANTASIAVARNIGSSWLRQIQESDGRAIEIYGQSRSS